MKKAFTLIEVLSVTAIIAVLAGLLFPVLISAKKRAKEATTISNLRQCTMAMLMYCDDYNGLQSMPSYESAKTVLTKAPTCDTLDYWRTNCSQDWGVPLIGSYGYVRGVPEFATSELGWTNLINETNGNPTIFISPWHGNEKLIPYRGDSVPIDCMPSEACRYPNRLAYAQADGSVKILPNGRAGAPGGSGQLFSWSSAFYGKANN